MKLLPYLIFWILKGDHFCIDELGEKVICIPSEFCTLKIGVCKRVLSSSCCNKSASHDLHQPVSRKDIHDLHQAVIEESTHDLRKPITSEDTHDLRQPVTREDTHDLRQAVTEQSNHNLRQPVTEESNHNLRRPVTQEDSHDQRYPVVQETTHNLRQPVNTELPDIQVLAWLQNMHDLRWPVVEENSHDLRNFVSAKDDYFSYESAIPETPRSNGKENLDNTKGVQKSKVLENGGSSYYSKVCGMSGSNHSARLIGGTNSSYLQWPWMVSLQVLIGDDTVHKCGAALLTELWIITAAHCVDEYDHQVYSARIGDYNLIRDGEPHPYQERSVVQIVMHPDFHSVLLEHDLALLRMDTPVTFGQNVIPVCLPRRVGQVEGGTATVIGWGKVISGALQELNLPILTNSECEEMYARVGVQESLPGFFLCAGTESGGRDACDGDSGGPLLIKDEDGRWALIGIVSWGRICAAPNMPGVYTRISYYLDFIDQIIQ